MILTIIRFIINFTARDYLIELWEYLYFSSRLIDMSQETHRVEDGSSKVAD